MRLASILDPCVCLLAYLFLSLCNSFLTLKTKISSSKKKISTTQRWIQEQVKIPWHLPPPHSSSDPWPSCPTLSPTVSNWVCLPLVKAIVFPVVMYGCESWTIKKAEHQRIDAFELWCWRRLLRVPWTARRSNQSVPKDTSPGCSLEGLMLKLKLQYSGHLMRRADSLEKTLMLGKIEGRRRRGPQRMRWLDGCSPWGLKESDLTERLNWTELNWASL